MNLLRKNSARILGSRYEAVARDIENLVVITNDLLRVAQKIYEDFQ